MARDLAKECDQLLAAKDQTIAALTERVRVLEEAARDALSGWRYIRQAHGDLYGVGWERVQDKLEAALNEGSD